MKLSGEIKSGSLIIDKDAFTGWVRSQPDMSIILTIKKDSDNRSLKQNRLYWSNNQMIADFTGELTADEIHEQIVVRCGFVREKLFLGKAIETRMTTKDLDKLEFSRLIDEQHRVALFLGLEVEI